MRHELKIEKQWADAKLAGEKPFELRLNDRGFQKGDRIQYRVVDPKTHEPYRRPNGDIEFGSDAAHPLEHCEFEITYVREGTENGLQPKYCVFADRPVQAVRKQEITAVLHKGFIVTGDNFRPGPGDDEDLLDAKIAFYTVNRMCISDQTMLDRLSKRVNGKEDA